MREEQIELLDLGAASVLTKGIPEQDAVEELNGEDFRE